MPSLPSYWISPLQALSYATGEIAQHGTNRHIALYTALHHVELYHIASYHLLFNDKFRPSHCSPLDELWYLPNFINFFYYMLNLNFCLPFSSFSACYPTCRPLFAFSPSSLFLLLF